MDAIKVATRVRPLLPREAGGGSQWAVSGDSISQISAPSSSYAFDHVFGAAVQTWEIFNMLAKPIIESVMEGFNGTIFAYGQTSSGKTHTMMGCEEDIGITPLTVQAIFSYIDEHPDREFIIRVSYLEIYKESLIDLLHPDNKELRIREDPQRNITVQGLSEEPVTTEEAIAQHLYFGDANRRVGRTNMNDRSSRSHTIFMLAIESRLREELALGDSTVKFSTLNLVDLAGSERVSTAGTEGDRRKEGIFINSSLLVLGNVISKLSEGVRVSSHIPFRESKLTRILQPSLGGNAKTCIICAVSPAEVGETHSTLKFASRAKTIKNKPIVNEVVVGEAALRKKLEKSVQENELLKQRLKGSTQEQERLLLTQQLTQMENEKTQLQTRIQSMTDIIIKSSSGEGIAVEPSEARSLRRQTVCPGVLARDLPLSVHKPLAAVAMDTTSTPARLRDVTFTAPAHHTPGFRTYFDHLTFERHLEEYVSPMRDRRRTRVNPCPSFIPRKEAFADDSLESSVNSNMLSETQSPHVLAPASVVDAQTQTGGWGEEEEEEEEEPVPPAAPVVSPSLDDSTHRIEMSRATADTEQLKFELDEKGLVIDDLEDKLASSEDRIAAQEEHLMSLQERLKQAHSKINQYEDAQNMEDRQAQSLEATLTKMKDQLHDSECQRLVLEEQLDGSAQEVAAMRQHLVTLQEQLEKVSPTTPSSSSSSSSKSGEQLKLRCQALEEKNCTLEGEKDKLLQQVEQQHSTLEVVQRELGKLEEEKMQLLRKVDEGETMLGDMVQEYESTQRQLEQAKDSVIAELTKECSSLKLELSEPRTHLQGASHPTNTADDDRERLRSELQSAQQLLKQQESSVAGLLQRCSQLEQQACDSKVAAADSLEEVQAQLTERTSLVDKLQLELKETQQLLASKECAVQRLQEEAATSTATSSKIIRELEEAVTVVVEQKDEAWAVQAEFEDKACDLEQENHKLTQQVAEGGVVISGLQAELETARQLLAQQESSVAGLLQRCSQLEQQACDSKVAAADSLEEVQAQLTERTSLVDNLQLELKETQQLLASKECAVQRLQEEAAYSSKIIRELEEAVTVVGEQKDEAWAVQAEFEDKACDLEQENLKLTQQVAEGGVVISGLQAELETARQLLATAEAAALESRLQPEVSDTEQQLSTLQEENAKQKKKIEELDEAIGISLEKNSEAWVVQAEFEDKACDLEQENHKLTQQVAEGGVVISGLQAELQTARQLLATAEAAALESRLQPEVSDTQQQLSTLQEENAKQKKKIEELDEAIGISLEKNGEAWAVQAEFEDKSCDLEEENLKLTQQVAEGGVVISGLQAELETAQQLLATAEAAALESRLQPEVSDTEQQLSTLQEENAKQKKKIEELDEAIGVSLEKNSEAWAVQAEFEDKACDLEQENLKLTQQVAEGGVVISGLQAELETARQLLARGGSQGDRPQLEEEVCQLRHEVHQLRERADVASAMFQEKVHEVLDLQEKLEQMQLSSQKDIKEKQMNIVLLKKENSRLREKIQGLSSLPRVEVASTAVDGSGTVTGIAFHQLQQEKRVLLREKAQLSMRVKQLTDSRHKCTQQYNKMRDERNSLQAKYSACKEVCSCGSVEKMKQGAMASMRKAVPLSPSRAQPMPRLDYGSGAKESPPLPLSAPKTAPAGSPVSDPSDHPWDRTIIVPSKVRGRGEERPDNCEVQ